MSQMKLTNINTYINSENRCYINVGVEMLLIYMENVHIFTKIILCDYIYFTE